MRRVRAAAAVAAAAAVVVLVLVVVVVVVVAGAAVEPLVRHFLRQGEKKETWKLKWIRADLSSRLSVSCTISAPLPAGSNDDEHDSRWFQLLAPAAAC